MYRTAGPGMSKSTRDAAMNTGSEESAGTSDDGSQQAGESAGDLAVVYPARASLPVEDLKRVSPAGHVTRRPAMTSATDDGEVAVIQPGSSRRCSGTPRN